MADISMCKNTNCPSKNKCYRFTAPVNPIWQSYLNFEVIDGKESCDWFWDNKNNNNYIEEDE